jgi:hypothetical protein
MARYYFKKTGELTPAEIAELRRLEGELKALNLGRGTWMGGEFGVSGSAEYFFKFEFHYMYDDGDYFFRYYKLDQNTGKVKQVPHGDPRINELTLTVTPELEAQIIAFLESLVKTRAFNIRKHALAAYNAAGKVSTRRGGRRSRPRRSTRRHRRAGI